MDILSKDNLRALMEPVEPSAGPCLSMFAPMERAGKETRKNALYVKNLLQEAEERLEGLGLQASDRRDLLHPIQSLLDEGIFWQYQSDGLALFRARDRFFTYRLPLSFEPLLVVTDRFHLKPLLPTFVGNDTFYILALSQQQVRLLRGTRYQVDEVELPPEMPKSLDEVLAYDVPQEQTQFHTGEPTRRGSPQAPIYHGQGGIKEQQQTHLLRYFTEVDRGVREVLKDERSPVVLAGVEHVLSAYRERNSSCCLVEEEVRGNPDLARPEDLHAQAWEIVQPILTQEQHQALERYQQQQAVGSPQASADLRTVVAAAAYGRVETLFVTPGVQTWGTFDPQTNAVEVHETARPGDNDLQDLTAAYTLLNGGTVYAVEAEAVPGPGMLAALFRY